MKEIREEALFFIYLVVFHLTALRFVIGIYSFNAAIFDNANPYFRRVVYTVGSINLLQRALPFFPGNDGQLELN